jgi:hypothetical protein
MRWMVDFAEAEAAGMALRLQLGAAWTEGLTRLLVVGFKEVRSFQ